MLRRVRLLGSLQCRNARRHELGAVAANGTTRFHEREAQDVATEPLVNTQGPSVRGADADAPQRVVGRRLRKNGVASREQHTSQVCVPLKLLPNHLEGHLLEVLHPQSLVKVPDAPTQGLARPRIGRPHDLREHLLVAHQRGLGEHDRLLAELTLDSGRQAHLPSEGRQGVIVRWSIPVEVAELSELLPAPVAVEGNDSAWGSVDVGWRCSRLPPHANSHQPPKAPNDA
mmetsp:Transcript_6057/g.16970  ORF Transcript_6057/g.16970 Transcript_6057/m.16970 type:complete len:229 (-) Transcript_6057:23-709(-)